MADYNATIIDYLNNVQTSKNINTMEMEYLQGILDVTSGDYNSLYHQYWNFLGIDQGDFNTRATKWLTARGYTQGDLNSKLRAYWSSYPLDANTEVISLTAYDGHEIASGGSAGWVTGYGSTLGVTGQISGVLYHTGYHYTTIPFKQGTQLTSAVLQIYCGWKQSTGAKLRFQCEDADTVDAPSDASGKLITDRVSDPGLTTAYTDQDSDDFTAGAVTNVDITTAVNEVLARPGWEPNNNLNVISMGTGSTNGHYVSAALIGHGSSNATPLVLTP